MHAEFAVAGVATLIAIWLAISVASDLRVLKRYGVQKKRGASDDAQSPKRYPGQAGLHNRI